MRGHRDWTGYIEGYCGDFCLGMVKARTKGHCLVLSAGHTRAVLRFGSPIRKRLTAVTLYSTLSRFKVCYRPEGGTGRGFIPFDMESVNSVEGFLNIAFLSGWREQWHYAGGALVLREAYSALLGDGTGDGPFYSRREGAGLFSSLRLMLGIGGRVEKFHFRGVLAEGGGPDIR